MCTYTKAGRNWIGFRVRPNMAGTSVRAGGRAVACGRELTWRSRACARRVHACWAGRVPAAAGAPPPVVGEVLRTPLILLSRLPCPACRGRRGRHADRAAQGGHAGDAAVYGRPPQKGDSGRCRRLGPGQGQGAARRGLLGHCRLVRVSPACRRRACARRRTQTRVGARRCCRPEGMQRPPRVCTLTRAHTHLLRSLLRLGPPAGRFRRTG